MSAIDDIAAYLAYLKTGGNRIGQIIFDELPNGEGMTATDELRRLLDERGVEWRKAPHYSSESQDNETIFEGNGIEWYTNDHMNGRLGLRALRYEVTPEQAVEATLGRGTCRVVRKPVSYSDDWKESLEAAGVVEVYTPTCSECGAYIEPPSEFTAGWNYCPDCGRRIER